MHGYTPRSGDTSRRDLHGGCFGSRSNATSAVQRGVVQIRVPGCCVSRAHWGCEVTLGSWESTRAANSESVQVGMMRMPLAEIRRGGQRRCD